MSDDKDKMLRKSLENINFLIDALRWWIKTHSTEPDYNIPGLKKAEKFRDKLEEYFKQGS